MATKNQPVEQCCICGCKVHRGGEYATPTIQGRAHATKHHFVAERFFGRSANRRGDQRKPVFSSCPWGVEGKSAVFCYECHELLVHNPVFLEEDLKRFALLVQKRGFKEEIKTESTEKLAGRIDLLHEVIAQGLASCLADVDRRQRGE